MSSKTEGPDKPQSQRPGETTVAGTAAAAGGGAKKPYATLDLKAVEVKEAGKAGDPVKAEPGKNETGKSGEKPSAILTGAQPPKAGEAKPTAATSKEPGAETTKSEASKPNVGKPEAAKAARPAAPQAVAAEAQKRGGAGIGGFFTHLAAGVVGGFLALLGADTIGQKVLPELGLPAPSSALTETTQQLQARIAALEAQAKKPATDSVTAQKLAAAETRLAKLEAAQTDTAKRIAETQKLAEGAANKGGSETADARIGKLEEKINTLVTAAGTEPEKAARIPALALVTGKISDLEATTTNQLAALRKSVGEQIDARVAAVAEASEQARSGTQRLDRDVAGLKADTARLKSDSDRMAVGLKTAQDDVAAAKGAIDTLRSSVEQGFKTAAKPADVSAAVAPVVNKLNALEGSVDSVVKSEQSRKANAERIVLSLELGNLKRVLDRGAPYAAELAEVKKASAGKIDLSALDRYKDSGVATLADLTREFRAVANAVLDADAEQAAGGSIVDRLLAGAKSVVHVRKVGGDVNGSGVEAQLARMENALKDGRLGAVIEEGQTLPPKAAAPAQEWFAKVEARGKVDRAIATVDQSLKASLAAAPEANDTSKK